MTRAAALAAAVVIIALPTTALAHPLGQRPVAFLERDSSGVSFDWVIAMDEVRVLATQLRLGPIRPESLAPAPELVRYMRSRVRIETAAGTCEMARIVVGAQASTGWSLRTRFECGARPDGVLVTLTLLQDISPDYVTLWQAATTAGRARGAFTTARPSQRIVFAAVAPVLPTPSAGAAPRSLTARVIDAVQSGRGLPLALLLAFLLGAGHALAPGHGKTIAAAVMVSGGGRRQALSLALAVAGTHLVSVSVLSAVVIGAGAYAIPRGAAPVLQAIAGILALAMAWRIWRGSDAHEHAHHDLEDGSHEHEHAHARGNAGASVGAGIIGGLVPSPGAVSLALVAFAAGRWVTGVVAIGAFSVGLGAVVFAVALVAARGRAFAAGRAAGLADRLRRAAAVAIGATGALLIVTAIAR